MFADFSAITAGQWTVIASIIGICFAFSAWSILDAWKRTYESANEKLLWMQLCIFVPIIGSVAYLFIGRKRGSSRS
ncbi:MAG: PLD nuclease N-terminal domain-containing protein [Pseudomonadota bacterium]